MKRTISLAAGALIALSLALVPLAQADKNRGGDRGGNVRSGDTTVTVDPATAAALQGAGISVEDTGRAYPAGEGDEVAFRFPVTGGKLSESRARIKHAGGLRLFDSDDSVVARRYVIKLPENILTAQVPGVGRIPFLDLTGGTATSSGRTTTIRGVQLDLTQTAADALNATFDTTIFTDATKIGSADVIVKTKGGRKGGGGRDDDDRRGDGRGDRDKHDKDGKGKGGKDDKDDDEDDDEDDDD